MTVTKHICTQGEEFANLKKDNEITLLKMDRIEEKVDQVKEDIAEIYKFIKASDEKYVSKAQVKFAFTILSYGVSIGLGGYYLLEWAIKHI